MTRIERVLYPVMAFNAWVARNHWRRAIAFSAVSGAAWFWNLHPVTACAVGLIYGGVIGMHFMAEDDTT